MKKLLVLLVLCSLAAVGWWLVRPAYRASKERRFAAQSQKALVAGAHRKALLAAQQVLGLNPNNVAACEVMADLADLSRSPHAIEWRKRVATFQPTLSNQVILASCALRYEQPPFSLAAQTLGSLAGKAETFAPYHVVSAQLALKQGRNANAEKEFEKAIQLEPTNRLHQFNLAVMRLESSDTTKSARGRDELLALTSQAAFSAQALRTLAQHYVARKDMAEGLKYSAEILKQRQATFEDSLNHLALLRETKSPQYGVFAGQLRAKAGTNVLEIAALAGQLTAFNEARQALDWLKSLSQAMQGQQPIPLAIANAYAVLKEWHSLEEYLRARNWKDRDCVRLALLAYAVRNQQDEAVARVHWDHAVKAAAERVELLQVLARMAAGWNWRTETDELLWRVARELPGERWPVESLNQIYAQDRNSRGLLSLYSLLLDRDATNAVAQNNVASLSLLLGTNVARAHQLAASVYRVNTNNIGFISTYAWSLHLQGRSAEALRLMERIDPRYFADPSLASYYGALLAANSQGEKARPLLAKAEGANIFPEEKALAAKARASLSH